MFKAKLEVVDVRRSQTSNQHTIVLEARNEDTIPMSHRLSPHNPIGRVEIKTDNHAAIDMLKKGRFFHFDLSPYPGP